ncbi:hypothetical protein OS493_016388 [Desmophyllum pertusum]|uniref:Uncharacterized protein n=1 Tax=Desmophyllum pertusum TaxID=174260 RepID=A0A9W9ZR21_9CNID|nr:hypothetical protein OS493_016388 [Desmophyllum pertusum]
MSNNRKQVPVWTAGTEVVGRFQFRARTQEDLSFEKDEVLYIESVTRDPNWYRAKNAKGRKGMIPYNYVEENKRAVKLHAMPWFHGKITREQAEALLTPYEDGLFLVRESHNFQGDYTLSVCGGSRLEHYRVRYMDDSKLTVDDETYFENLTKLVEHYQDDADGLCTRLAKPWKRKGNLISLLIQSHLKKRVGLYCAMIYILEDPLEKESLEMSFKLNTRERKWLSNHY